MTSLAARLKRQIVLDGPMTVAAFMTACLHDPIYGYYAVHPRLGAQGDFITAPTLSQMFGELLGAWVAQVWIELGRPSTVALIELGPGDGALMGDALRVLGRAPGFVDAARLWLVEPSGPLKALQLERLGRQAAHWTDRLEDVPAGAPMIVIANEVLDCLPVRQFVRTAQGWAERRVGLNPSGELAFGLSPAAPEAFSAGLDTAPLGAVLERSPAQDALGAELGARVAHDGGAALLIDYGRERFGFGDTLQAIRAHRKVGVLDAPGDADLTVHADFPSVAAAARAVGAAVTAITPQGGFLTALGIRSRATALSRSRPDQAGVIARQLGRLIDDDQMGEVFKVLAIHEKGLRIPGLEPCP